MRCRLKKQRPRPNLSQAEKMKEHVDHRRREKLNLVSGELVLVYHNVRRKGKTHIFLPKFIWPLQIVRRVGPVMYLVEDIPGRRTRRRYRWFNAHECQLKRFLLRQMQQEFAVNEPVPEGNLAEVLNLTYMCDVSLVTRRTTDWRKWTRNGSHRC